MKCTGYAGSETKHHRHHHYHNQTKPFQRSADRFLSSTWMQRLNFRVSFSRLFSPLLSVFESVKRSKHVSSIHMLCVLQCHKQQETDSNSLFVGGRKWAHFRKLFMTYVCFMCCSNAVAVLVNLNNRKKYFGIFFPCCCSVVWNISFFFSHFIAVLLCKSHSVHNTHTHIKIVCTARWCVVFVGCPLSSKRIYARIVASNKPFEMPLFTLLIDANYNTVKIQ